MPESPIRGTVDLRRNTQALATIFSERDTPPSGPKDKEHFLLVAWQEATQSRQGRETEWPRVMETEGLEAGRDRNLQPPACGAG